MTTYEDYLQRIEGTWASASFEILADDLDADDSLGFKERDTLKRYAMYKLRCVCRIRKEYELKEIEFIIEYREDHEGRFIASMILQDFKDDTLITSHIATIIIKPGVEIKITSEPEAVNVLEDDELKVLIYPGGL